MKIKDLSGNPESYVSGCGCPSCCDSNVDYVAQDLQYDATSYVKSSISQFAKTILSDLDTPQLPVLTQGEANLQLTSQTVNEPPVLLMARQLEEAEEGDPQIPLAAVQGGSAIAFSDVTQIAGLELPTQTWGSAVGDYDGDGNMDIWLNRHQQNAILYRNQGDGTFADVTDEVFLEGETKGDFHGAAFVDINNDGRQDLLQSAGGDQGAEADNPNKEKKLFINSNEPWQNQSGELGVDYLTGRGRINTVADFNQDGLLDYFFTGPLPEDAASPPTLFLQQADGSFFNAGPSGVALDVPSGTFGIVSDLTGDGKVELIYAANSPRLQIYETSSPSANEVIFTDITADLMVETSNATVQDVVVGDFNGDKRQDLFVVYQSSSSSGVRIDSATSGRARLLVTKPMQRGIELTMTGRLDLNFQGDPEIVLPQFMQGVGITPDEIKIGASGRSPDSLIFGLDPEQDAGLATYQPGEDSGVFIGYENGRWKILLSNRSFDEVNFLYNSNQTIEEITAVNFPLTPARRQSSLLINTEAGFVDQTAGSGLDVGVTASNAVSGDFDNDGDLDIYMVVTDLTSNQPNILFENLGDGTFVPLNDAAGASGRPVDGAIPGVGDGVSVLDYDNDGDQDLYVTNGDVAGFRRSFLIDGSPNLFQNNQTSGNHWINITLEGTESNRNAIGARVELTAGGQTQVREQTAGIHNRSQDDSRMHFGLGQIETIDEIRVVWPNGMEELILNVNGDQFVTIVEGSGVAVATNPTPDGNTGNQSIIEGTNSSDMLLGTSGRNVIRSRAGNDSIQGLGGNDNLLGGAGQDSLAGGDGNDLIVGGQGQDVVSGGAGVDKFLFTTPDAADTITDFQPGEDVIRVRVASFGGGLTAGDLQANQFHLGGVATQSSHRLVYDPGTGELMFDPDGTGAVAAITLATLEGLPAVTEADIKLV